MIDLGAIEGSFPGLGALFAVYAKADEGIRLFGERFGVRCPAGCCRCCETPSDNIDVSVLEALPVAIHLYRSGRADAYHEMLSNLAPGAPCAMISRTEEERRESGCSVYPLRPLTCRVFGYCSVLDKQGVKKASICRLLKEADPGLKARIDAAIGAIEGIPILTHIASEASGIEPSLGERRTGINEALRRAIEIVGYRFGR